MDNSDKTSRSIFVGNIPYEATEEKLMQLFGQAGTVIGFRLVYDRESGKPKGYGFCEYNSAEIAQSAIRNLKDIDFNGRALRIGPAAGEQNSAEVAMNNNTAMKPPQESPYGEECDPAQSPIIIAQVVASRSPEFLFQFMTEMKEFIRDNPVEAEQFFNQNPQVTYFALLAQVRMKMIDPKKAVSMLSHSNDHTPVLYPDNSAMVATQQAQMQPQMSSGSMQAMAPPPPHQSSAPIGMPMFMPPVQQPFPSNMQHMQMPPHMMTNISMPSSMPPPPPHFGQFAPVLTTQQQQQAPPSFIPPSVTVASTSFTGISTKMEPTDADISNNLSEPQKQAMDMMRIFDNHDEKEKAALILQVLSLTDDQVAMLPEDQRTSIKVLKDQLKDN